MPISVTTLPFMETAPLAISSSASLLEQMPAVAIYLFSLIKPSSANVGFLL